MIEFPDVVWVKGPRGWVSRDVTDTDRRRRHFVKSAFAEREPEARQELFRVAKSILIG